MSYSIILSVIGVIYYACKILPTYIDLILRGFNLVHHMLPVVVLLYSAIVSLGTCSTHLMYNIPILSRGCRKNSQDSCTMTIHNNHNIGNIRLYGITTLLLRESWNTWFSPH